MQMNQKSGSSIREFGKVDSGKIQKLIDTALGKEKADTVVANADIINVYSGELLRGWSVAIKGDRIAYVGEGADHTVGPDTKFIDASGKILAPGFIDAHAHTLALCHIDEFLKYVIKGGTTTIISETKEFVIPLGYRGVWQFLKAAENQPIKIFTSVSPLLDKNCGTQKKVLSRQKLRRLLKQNGVIGLGETTWQFILQDDENLLQLYAETLNSGKCLEGHSAGARGEKLAAYVAAGISSCHESTTAEEALERLRLGLHVLIREGAVRRELEAVSSIKDEPIDFRRLALCVDGIIPEHLIKHGYMEFVVQKAIDLGFDPIVAIQMATINPAEHFHLDKLIGGVAPGRYADMVILPDIRDIKAEMVFSNGKIIVQKGNILVPPRKHIYPRSTLRSIHLPRKLRPADFQIHAPEGDTPVTIRVINQVTGLVTREDQITMTPEKGFLKPDLGRDIIKIAFIDRTNNPGKMFTGFVKGFGLRGGAFATSATWSIPGITVVGTNDEDMAEAVNRIKALRGGAVICEGGRITGELPLPIAGYVSDLPLEIIDERYSGILQRANSLGVPYDNPHLTLTTLSTNVIPFLRICESGLMDVGKGELINLIV